MRDDCSTRTNFCVLHASTKFSPGPEFVHQQVKRTTQTLFVRRLKHVKVEWWCALCRTHPCCFFKLILHPLPHPAPRIVETFYPDLLVFGWLTATSACSGSLNDPCITHFMSGLWTSLSKLCATYIATQQPWAPPCCRYSLCHSDVQDIPRQIKTKQLQYNWSLKHEAIVLWSLIKLLHNLRMTRPTKLMGICHLMIIIW